MRHFIPANFNPPRVGSCWDQSTTHKAPLGRYHSEADINVRLSFILGAIKYACIFDEGTLISSGEREILYGTFEIILPEIWHTRTPMTEDSLFTLDFFGLNRQ